MFSTGARSGQISVFRGLERFDSIRFDLEQVDLMPVTRVEALHRRHKSNFRNRLGDSSFGNLFENHGCLEFRAEREICTAWGLESTYS